MAVIASTTLSSANGATALTVTTLSASDTLTYVSGGGQVLTVTNPTGGSLTLNIDGAGSTTISPAGYGGTVSVAGGYDIVLAAGVTKAVRLDTIAAFLSGVITCTGAATCTATLTI